MSITKIKTEKDKYKAECKELLEEAIDMGFVDIVIIATCDQNLMHIKASASKSTPDKIAALEIAKLEIYSTWTST